MALQDRIAIVTGAGAGMGRAVCELFAKEGAKVAAADINLTAAKATVQSLENAANHAAFTVDVASGKSVDQLGQDILAKFGEAPSIVVNCAGVLEYFDGLLSCTEERWDRTVDINLKGTFLINRKFAVLMKEAGIKGSLVNFSSTASTGSNGCPEYSAAKAGVEGFCKSIAKELGPFGIRVNCVQPGPINTALCQGIGEQRLTGILAATPLKRLGEPSEVAELCLWLASSRSSYMTGAVLLISGGFCR